jgi:hypothetical protein
LSCHWIWIEPLLRGHLYYKVIFSLSQRWPLNTGLTIWKKTTCGETHIDKIDSFVWLQLSLSYSCDHSSLPLIRYTLLQWLRFMVYFSYIVVETGVPWENHWPVVSYRPTLSHNVVPTSEYTSPWTGFELTTLMVIDIDCIGSCKSNYHTITTIAAPSTMEKCPYTSGIFSLGGANLLYFTISLHLKYGLIREGGVL